MTLPEPQLPPDLTFEQALERLEAIVAEMETGRMPLDQALRRFEEGSALAAFCARKLDEAERKIEVLAKRPDGSWERKPFAPQDAGREAETDEENEPGGTLL